MMHISETGLDLIKRFEGLRTEAYKDSAGVWTIGYGHTRSVDRGDKITEAEAEELLRQDVAWAESAVRDNVKVDLTQSQFDALVSFVFNVGAGAFRSSTLLRKLNKGRYGAVPAELARWDKATVNGKKTQLAGLARRRAAEADLWAQDGEDLQAHPDPVKDKTVSRSKEGQGAGISGIGAIGAAASEGASQIQPLAQYSDILMYAFVALTLVGVGIVIYGKIQEDD